MVGPKNLSHFIIAMVTIIALLDVNMQCVTHANSTTEADEVGYDST
ncbi:MAG: hypothetical protein ACREA7_05525 [Nitrosotalea sp.]